MSLSGGRCDVLSAAPDVGVSDGESLFPTRSFDAVQDVLVRSLGIV